MLEEHQILLCLQEMDLEVQEVILVEEQAHGLHPPNGWDLSTELEETPACMDGIKSERGSKAGQLSQLVMGISNTLVNLGMLPVQDILQRLHSAREVLEVVGPILDHLQEARASSADPWD
jgi:hypothetical protein